MAYSPAAGFRYTITGEGGSGHIRNKVLKAVLDGEREECRQGRGPRSTLAPCNYEFQAAGVDAEGPRQGAALAEAQGARAD